MVGIGGNDDRRECSHIAFRWLGPDVNKIKVNFDEEVIDMVPACAFVMLTHMGVVVGAGCHKYYRAMS